MSCSALLFSKSVTSINKNNELDYPTSIDKTCYVNPDDCGTANYQDDAGLVVIEAENLEISGTNWNIKTNFNDYTGAGYLSWDGNNSLNNPGNGLITTSIKISTPGTYRFQWRSRIGVGSNSTEHNDSWLRFPNASDFYAEKNGNRIYPKGSGQTPNPNGAGSDGWFKIYLSGSTNWTWSTRTSDNDAHDIFVVFNTPGIYSMEISGRSQYHLIDRITLSNNTNNPLDLGNSETPCSEGALSLNNLNSKTKKASISLFPNPTDHIINLSINIKNWSRTVAVYDFKGVQILEVEVSESNGEIDVSRLSSGFYFLKTDKMESRNFIKK